MRQQFPLKPGEEISQDLWLPTPAMASCTVAQFCLTKKTGSEGIFEDISTGRASQKSL